MQVLRHIFCCLSIAIVFAITLNGVAMAANDLSHQTHCLNAVGNSADHAKMGHAHDHEGVAAKHTTPGHDHETCMMHACTALSVDAVKLRKLADTLLATLVWPESHAYALERSDGLKRPPKS